ncbi:MAG TPA: hypothetical protein VJT32_02485 [bacterium]|nr:hypothetical protein [bacterium]
MTAPGAVKKFLAAMAKKGGQARAKALTAKRRREIARKAVVARWKRAKAKPAG